MELVKPCKEYADQWWKALREFEDEGLNGFWNSPEKPIDIDSYIKRVEDYEKGINQPEGYVPSSTFWLIDDGKFIGHLNLRHELNDRLNKIGGHIGYYLRRKFRGKGYGTKMLSLSLFEARNLGLKRVLLTTDEWNIASQRVMEKNGGEYQDTIEFEGHKLMRYWIDL